jgi:hypothetical protein
MEIIVLISFAQNPCAGQGSMALNSTAPASEAVVQQQGNLPENAAPGGMQ